MDAGDMDRIALKKALSKIELKADARRFDDLEKERVRAEIAKLQAEHARLKEAELLQQVMGTAPQRLTNKNVQQPGTEVCLWCDKHFPIFALSIHVKDSDGRSFCSDPCMVAQMTFDHQELQAGLDYVKRSLGTEEEIA